MLRCHCEDGVIVTDKVIHLKEVSHSERSSKPFADLSEVKNPLRISREQQSATIQGILHFVNYC